MAINPTPLSGLALPDQGEWAGTWGTNTNNQITSLLDTAVAGTTTLSTDTDVTLSSTNYVANQARSIIINWTAANTVLRTITAPAQSKTYVVFNNSTGSPAANIKIVGAGPTTGVTIQPGTSAIVAWNGSDFVNVSEGLPPQTGNAGKYLTTDGSTASWSATGAAANGSIYINNQVVSSNYTIASGTNGFSVGPITVNSGVAVTVSSGQRWVVI